MSMLTSRLLHFPTSAFAFCVRFVPIEAPATLLKSVITSLIMVLGIQFFVGFALCTSTALAAVLAPRDETTSTSSMPSVALVATTISGQITTVSVAAPTTSVNLATSMSSSLTSSMQSAAASTSSTTTSAPDALSTNPLLCGNAVTGPFCLPSNESTLYVGNQYWGTKTGNSFAKRFINVIQ